MTDDNTSQPAGGEANIEDRLGSFDFDETAAPAAKPAENTEPGDSIDPIEAAAAAEIGAEQPEDDDPEIALRDNTKVKLSALKKAWNPNAEREYKEFEDRRRKFDSDAQQFQQYASSLTQREQQYSQALDAAITVLQNRLPKPPDRELLKIDPFAYQEQKLAYDDAMGELGQLGEKQRQLQTVAQQRHQQAFHQYVKKQHEALITAMPELKDSAKAAKFWEGAKSYGASVGFTAQEMAQVQDARVMMVLKDAQQWRAFQERAAKLKQKEKEAAPMPPPTTTPTRRVSSSERERTVVRDQLQRLRKTGSAKDAEAFLGNFD